MRKKLKIDLPKDKETLKGDYFSRLNKSNLIYKDLISSIIDSIYEIKNTKTIMVNQIDIFKEGLCQPNEIIFFDLSGKYLIQLLDYDDRIEKLILDLSTDKSSRTRFNIITLMLYKPNDKLIEVILKNGLKDKSFKVREKSADTILRLEKHNLLDELSNQITVEKDKDKINKLSIYYNILKDGYLVEKNEFGCNLTIKTKTGLTGRTIDESEYKDIENTIRKIKNE